jgi:prepilin signal peptidase PulO-like enzyme (type II secretory pathway)
MNKIKEVMVELLPTLFVLIFLVFLRGEIALFILILLASFITFKIKFHKKELYLFLFGFIMGIIFELIGNFVLGQSWPDASFFTIPIWLPLSWGYAFIVIRRIGNIIVK